MLYFWWLSAVLTPLVIADMLQLASPLYFPVWPLGFEYFPDER